MFHHVAKCGIQQCQPCAQYLLHPAVAANLRYMNPETAYILEPTQHLCVFLQ
jgi:hypothetical protein